MSSSRSRAAEVLSRINSVLVVAGLNDNVWSVRDCDSTLFVLLFKKRFGKLPGVIASPVSPAQHARNFDVVLRAVASDVLSMDLGHISPDALARGDLHDPLLSEANITVTQVEVSPDLQNATAFVVPLGGEQAPEIVGALNRAAGLLRGQPGREIDLRYTPRLGFAADRSFDRADEVERLLHSPRVRRDLERAGENGDERDEAADDGA